MEELEYMKTETARVRNPIIERTKVVLKGVGEAMANAAPGVAVALPGPVERRARSHP
ncbi:MAG: hypothetical protein KatS3mg087_0245 [Patescibacteria group bacterium]|nr:MAG: hypothetical protein KatS3mg087_0245 [Patescibacteria group bacterium]